jgi:ribonuclease D
MLCLKRDYGFQFANLFDTMVAARTLGWPQLGLGSLLEAHFGVTLNKRFQRADWGQRPLTPELLDYARFDTHFLLALSDKLAAELAAAGRTEEAYEEFERLQSVAALPANGANPNAFWRVNGARDLNPAQAAILRELFLYRERQAERADRPPFKVMSDQTLLEIARLAPQAPLDLESLPGMTPQQIRRHGAICWLRCARARLPARPPHFERSRTVRDRRIAAPVAQDAPRRAAWSPT